MLALLAIAAVVIVVLVIVIASQPAEFAVTRTAVLAAPPAKVFALVNELRQWESWSPWAKLDPNVRNTFEGPASGTGAVFAWDGNSKVGAGKMTILESRPDALVRLRLEFIRPFANTNLAEFTFAPEGEGTRVTWTMTGRKNFVSKAMCLVMNMDKLIGGDFERGLTQLGTLAKTSP